MRWDGTDVIPIIPLTAPLASLLSLFLCLNGAQVSPSDRRDWCDGVSCAKNGRKRLDLASVPAFKVARVRRNSPSPWSVGPEREQLEPCSWVLLVGNVNSWSLVKFWDDG